MALSVLMLIILSIQPSSPAFAQPYPLVPEIPTSHFCAELANIGCLHLGSYSKNIKVYVQCYKAEFKSVYIEGK